MSARFWAERESGVRVEAREAGDVSLGGGGDGGVQRNGGRARGDIRKGIKGEVTVIVKPVPEVLVVRLEPLLAFLDRAAELAVLLSAARPLVSQNKCQRKEIGSKDAVVPRVRRRNALISRKLRRSGGEKRLVPFSKAGPRAWG